MTIDRDAIKQRIAEVKSLVPVDAAKVPFLATRAPLLLKDVEVLLEELDALHSWSGLISLLDERYPADIFDGSSGDPGPRIVALIREVDQLRQDKQKLIEALDGLSGGWIECANYHEKWHPERCGECPPCNAAKVLSEVTE